MTAPTLSTRMLVGYDNKNILSEVSSITLNNISAAAGSDADNLLYEDPHLQFESTAPTADPEIIFTYSTSTSSADHFVQGVYNWDGIHDWDSLEIAVASSPGGPFFEAVTINLKPSVPANASPSFMFRHAGGSATNWRWKFILASGTRKRLKIGNLCQFRGYEIDMNPDTGGIRQSAIRQTRGRRSVGGGLHVARGADNPDRTAQFFFSRLDDTTVAKLYNIDEAFRGRFVGIIPPNQVGRELPLGLPHFLGRSLNVDATALHGATATTHAQRVVWTLEGAI